MGAGEIESVSQVVDQQHAGLDFTLMGDTIHRDIDFVFHQTTSSAAAWVQQIIRLVILQEGNCTAFCVKLACTRSGARKIFAAEDADNAD